MIWCSYLVNRIKNWWRLFFWATWVFFIEWSYLGFLWSMISHPGNSIAFEYRVPGRTCSIYTIVNLSNNIWNRKNNVSKLKNFESFDTKKTNNKFSFLWFPWDNLLQLSQKIRTQWSGILSASFIQIANCSKIELGQTLIKRRNVFLSL